MPTASARKALFSLRCQGLPPASLFTLLFLGFRIRLRQPFIPHQMEIVHNENVGGLQILIVCCVGLQIQHNGEMNGFVLTIKVMYAQYTKRIVTKDGDKYDVTIPIDEKGVFSHVYVWKNPDNNAKVERLASFSNVLYVHQLQNLMRLCELAEFANGFKVKGLDD